MAYLERVGATAQYCILKQEDGTFVIEDVKTGTYVGEPKEDRDAAVGTAVSKEVETSEKQPEPSVKSKAK